MVKKESAKPEGNTNVSIETFEMADNMESIESINSVRKSYQFFAFMVIFMVYPGSLTQHSILLFDGDRKFFEVAKTWNF